MYKITSQLLMYGDMPADSIVMQLADIHKKLDDGSQSKDELSTRALTQVKHLLQVATDYGFNHNLWQNYLTFLLITEENPFSITCEKIGASTGSVNTFALGDFAAFRTLFHFDFTPLEKALGLNCFSIIQDYQAISKPELMYNHNVSEKVQTLSAILADATTDQAFFDAVTQFYKDFGVGMFGLNKAFRISESGNGSVRFNAINNMDTVMLDDLVGYELQKKRLVENTEAFVCGRKANNVLLYGDSGTGKSTSIKAIVNQFYGQGLRMIEIYKHQFKDLSTVIGQIKNRNYRFIIYMDDLSFEEFEIEYKFLKAVIEGGVESKPENILIYATSNRRHLIKENFNDRSDMEHRGDVHRSDTIEEKLSLVNRFGVSINYSKPTHDEYHTIVAGLAKSSGITMDDATLFLEADRWEMRNGGLSGRTAQQFINHLLGLSNV